MLDDGEVVVAGTAPATGLVVWMLAGGGAVDAGAVPVAELVI